MKKKVEILLCNVEGFESGTGETEFYPACLDCVKHPSRITRCLEKVEKELGIKCCGLCEHWVDPKPTGSDENLIGACAVNPGVGGFSCYCECCEKFERRDPDELDEEDFDLSGLDSLPHSPKFNENDQGYIDL